MQSLFALFALLPLLPLLFSCSGTGVRDSRPISIMSYNVQNLFDAVDDGTEYAEFSVARGRWDATRYRRRLENLGKVVLEGPAAEIGVRGPDLLCLLEVEKPAVLEDLRRGPLKSGGYRYAAMSPAPGAAVNTALLSRFPLVCLRAHSISDSSATRGRRTMLEAVLEIEGSRLALLLCHWKSKLEGAEATEGERRETAALVSSRVAALLAADPALAIVVCGDFNENPDEFARVQGRYATAFLPLSEAGRASEGRLLLAAEAAQSGYRGSEPVLYSPWPESEGFSYAFKGVHERIDGFLLSASLLRGTSFLYLDFAPVAAPFLFDASGEPLGWSSYASSGFSDHLPILLRLERGPSPPQVSTRR